VISFGFYFQICQTEWVVLIGSIGFVLACEAFNSALENLADSISTEPNEKIKKAKDIAAAAVLISAASALIIGLIVFLPKIWALI
jgi:diacylglycerol kinase